MFVLLAGAVLDGFTDSRHRKETERLAGASADGGYDEEQWTSSSDCGSNTARSLELRCETCNRKKGATI